MEYSELGDIEEYDIVIYFYLFQNLKLFWNAFGGGLNNTELNIK